MVSVHMTAVGTLAFAACLTLPPAKGGAWMNLDRWSLSATNIVVATGVFLEGEMSCSSPAQGKCAIAVKINDVPVNNWHDLVIRTRVFQNKKSCRVYVDLFYDFVRRRFFFEHPGTYHLEVLKGDGGEHLVSSEVHVRDVRADEREALALFRKRDSLEVLVGHHPNEDGIANLLLLGEKYPTTPWAPYATTSAGIAMFQRIGKGPVQSKQDVIERRARRARLAGMFRDAAHGQYGALSDQARLHLGLCLALKGRMDAAKASLRRAGASATPSVASKASHILKEIESVHDGKGQDNKVSGFHKQQ